MAVNWAGRRSLCRSSRPDNRLDFSATLPLVSKRSSQISFILAWINWLRMGLLLGIMLSLWPVAGQGASPLPAPALGKISGDYGEISVYPVAAETNSVQLGVHYNLAPGWHLYWRHPGQAGLAPTFKFSSGDGSKIEHTVQWPLPQRFFTSNIEQAGYLGEGAIPVLLDWPEQNRVAPLQGDFVLLVCKQICLPQRIQAAITGNDFATAAAQAGEFLIPPIIEVEDLPITGEWWLDQQNIFVQLDDPLNIIADPSQLFIEAGASGYGLAPDLIASRFARTKEDNQTDTGYGLLRSFHSRLIDTNPQELSQTTKLRVSFINQDGQAISGRVQLTAGSGGDFTLSASLTMLVLALAAGLILNFMPCVFPVLSMKVNVVITALTQPDQNGRLQLLATAAGILVMAFSLGLFAVLLRQFGSTLLWGQQYQSFWFVLVLAVLVTILALSLFELRWLVLAETGIYRAVNFITQPLLKADRRLDSNYPLLSAFLQGVMVFWLATPCGAPLLAGVLALALASNMAALLLLFIAIGCGLALPYLLLALAPRLLIRLPKPGRWQLMVKRAMAIPLLLLAGWLGFIAIQLNSNQTASAAPPSGWQQFSADRLAVLRAEGATIYVHITADWCLTCKLNQWQVLEDAAFKQLVSAQNWQLLWADWSKADAEIAKLLSDQRQYGLPYDAIYSPKLDAPLILPKLLTLSAISEQLPQLE